MTRRIPQTHFDDANPGTAQNRLLGAAARNLLGPIGKLRSCSELMIEDSAATLTEELRAFVKIIYESSDSMLRMANDLVVFSTIETGDLPLDPRTTDLIGLITHCLGPHVVIAEHKHIRLEFFHDGAIPEMRVDGPKMEQVLNNLVSNAIKFSYPNTNTCVSLTIAEEGVYLRVKDEGQGIPASEVGTLFKPFQRTSVRPTGGESSTGLGLAIVKKIVEGHGGAITVTSETGRGTEVVVLLPAALVVERPHVRSRTGAMQDR